MQIAARAEALVRTLSSKAGPDAEILRFHESDLSADPGRVAAELATGSLFGGTKIVWLTALPVKAQAMLAGIAAAPIEGAYLAVQAPDLKKSHKLVQAFEAAPFLAAIASYGEDQESLSAAIRRQAQSAGYEIAADAAALIAVRCDFSGLLAQSETEKLMTFAGASKRITLDDVEACLADQQTAGLSEIADCALKGEGRKALAAFERFMAAEQNVTPVLVVLSQTLMRLHAVRAAADSGAPLMQAIKELKPPVFFKQQDSLAAQARRWTAAALGAQIGQLNTALKESRLRPSLAEDITADLLIAIAKQARRA
jgi:DNA polymerase-3 subunit delta